MTESPFSIAILLSGAGSTMVNLQHHIQAGRVDARIVSVISSRNRAQGMDRARDLGLPVSVLPRRAYCQDGVFDVEAYNRDLGEMMKQVAPDLVVMAGFMTRLSTSFLDKWPAINIHPALLPAFGGKGCYGHRVHEAVIASGVKLSGATVHFASGEYDRGPIICQQAIPVKDTDTPDTLAHRVQILERELYPRAIQWIAQGRIVIDGNRTRLLEDAP